MRSYREEELRLLTQVLPGIAAELRGSMANVYFAANRLAPAEAREQDAQVDQNAAIFAQSFFRMSRVIGNMTDAAKLAKVAVTSEIVEHTKGPKIRIHKFKNKTGYHKRQGHRQPITVLKVTGIK